MNPGRNDPCPCGSGRKYKRCHLGRELAEDGPAPPPHLPAPYTVARTIDDAVHGRSTQLTDAQRRQLERRWTISRVAALPTEVIEQKLRDLRVRYSRERFLSLCEGRRSAWAVGEALRMASDDPEVDGELLGLAACELWKRLRPEPPSNEMIDDWMREGHEHAAAGRWADAVAAGWKAWDALQRRFTPLMRDIAAAEAAFHGTRPLAAWWPDFLEWLRAASARDASHAAVGRSFCTGWLEQFPDEGPRTRIDVQRALALFQFHLGDTAAGVATLEAIVERWPGEAAGWIALADALGRPWSAEPGPERDRPRALACLDRALAVARGDAERELVLERREAVELAVQ